MKTTVKEENVSALLSLLFSLRDPFVRSIYAGDVSHDDVFHPRSCAAHRNLCWLKAWDPFENGNNWRQLVRRRKTDRVLVTVIQVPMPVCT